MIADHSARVPITPQGEKALRVELDRLKHSERPAIIAALSEARAHGDLKENAEYHAAKELQKHIETRIVTVEKKLAQCQIIDVTTFHNDGRVIFGATVTLTALDHNQETVRYQIVGADEADLKLGKVSVVSPIARAMIGCHAGEQISVVTPRKSLKYKIDRVEYI